MTGKERNLYTCLFRSRQACTCVMNWIQMKSKHISQKFNFQLTFSLSNTIFWLKSASLQNNPSSSFLFIINSHKPGPGPKAGFLIGCDRVKVFVSLFSHSTGRCMRVSKRIGIETVGENNGERIMNKLRYRGGVCIEVWRIGLSEHTKEEESYTD